MTFDVLRARRETPAVANIMHFNNAGAALMPTPVVEAQINHIRRESEVGGYEAAAEASDRYQQIYGSVARLINANREEIALVENATIAWDMAFYAIPFRAGDRILTARSEYASNYIAFLQVARRTGAVIDMIPSSDSGELDIGALERMIDGRVKLIAITHVPTNGGLVNPAAEIGRIARAHGILFLLDACQSIGQMEVDVDSIGCDLLSATSRKYLRGPRGAGFLYVRSEVLEQLEPPFLDLHAASWVAQDRYEMRADARRFENWESNVAAQLGLGAAIDYALGWGLANIETRVVALAEDLRARLGAIPGVIIQDIGRRKCGIVSFTLAARASSEVVAELARRRINTVASSPRATLLDATARQLSDVIRASVHYYNSEEEIERFARAVASLA